MKTQGNRGEKACYDKKYFDRWYRHPHTKVSTRADSQRKAALVIAVAEYYLRRSVRTALDIGCGEGQWQPILKSLRPKIHYQGIDPSPYAISRYGRSRNIIAGAFGDLPMDHLLKQYDLIICSDILYYVETPALINGLNILLPRLSGIAFLEAYASDESLCGDTRGMKKRSVDFYRKTFSRVGLYPCGSHCYVGPALRDQVTPLESSARR